MGPARAPAEPDPETAPVVGWMFAQISEAYADITADAAGAQLRDLGVTVKPVREPMGRPLAGCERAAVEAALAVREGAHA